MQHNEFHFTNALAHTYTSRTCINHTKFLIRIGLLKILKLESITIRFQFNLHPKYPNYTGKLPVISPSIHH